MVQKKIRLKLQLNDFTAFTQQCTILEQNFGFQGNYMKDQIVFSY